MQQATQAGCRQSAVARFSFKVSDGGCKTLAGPSTYASPNGHKVRETREGCTATRASAEASGEPARGWIHCRR